jgi:hypothetical protein
MPATLRVHFFGSRLKYSRWAQVPLVDDERVEALVRSLVDHFAAMGGIPLLAVFDRPKTVALAWRRDGVVTEWNPTFAGMALDLGLGIEVCWPYSPRQNLNDIATHLPLSVTVLACGGPHASIQCARHPLGARFSTSTSPGPLTAAKSSPARKVK